MPLTLTDEDLPSQGGSSWAAQVAHLLKCDRKLYLKESKAGRPLCAVCKVAPVVASHNGPDMKPVYKPFCIQHDHMLRRIDSVASSVWWIHFDMRTNHIPLRRVSLDDPIAEEEELDDLF